MIELNKISRITDKAEYFCIDHGKKERKYGYS